ncbi:glycoside hydrolase family 29 protein [Moniliophthora roreri MCA 2997]|uniref:alpha-L-fucosidase n=2 Tax=Moniliophthora roreri TaxID=221103 RepID=V2XAE4_MONRO|nr:glycoside hydrolase family 29 protein [Moniliophthora roreri MCA 2997]
MHWPSFLSLIAAAGAVQQTQVDLTLFLNNKAAALTNFSTGNFDNHNGSYPAEYLPNGTLVDASVVYTLPNWTSPTGTYDNINCSGQTIELPRGKYHSFNFLGATDGTAYVNGEFFALYEGGEMESLGFVVAPWWLKNPSDGPITAPFLNEGDKNGSTHRNWNITRMFTFQHHLDNTKVLTGLILPNETSSSQLTGVVSVHIFAITLLSVTNDNSSDTNGPILNVQNVRSTANFRTVNESEVQLVEITLNNLALSANSSDTSNWLTKPVELSLCSHSVDTLIPGKVNRLRGGDQVRVLVGIINKEGVEAGTIVSGVKVKVTSQGEDEMLDAIWTITAGIPDYYVGDDSLRTHESTEWFNGAKFGIFVHWGIYSVPAYTLSGTQYAEWYWYWQHNPANESSRVWTYHKETYGEGSLYDMFFDEFTGTEWTAERWLDFVRDSGAKYYVITTKHHDGFALFDTGNSSNRNSLQYGPQRDIIGELTNATNAYNALVTLDKKIYNGLYFSLPEWFNPAFAKYGHAGGGDDLYHRRSSDPNNPGYNILQRTGFAGGLAKNAYNESAPPEPYTGYVEVGDYLQDIMKPQMEALMYKYDMDIMWCDVGGPTVFPDIAPGWFNYARSQGRQVIANARCGANYSDFDNPEYSPTSHLKTRKWESSEGSDPYSYGYNRDTPWQNYRNATYVLHSLIDIVSKNGNYLIDVGPTANGSIVPPSRESLLKVGKWLNSGSGEAIYDTQYWYVAQEDKEAELRFTTKPDAFYITSLRYPENGVIRSSLPLPVKLGDVATFLDSGNNTKELEWHWTEHGVFELFVDEEEIRKVEDAWAFRINYSI